MSTIFIDINLYVKTKAVKFYDLVAKLHRDYFYCRIAESKVFYR
jgi:hypothetical protein